MTSTAKSPAAEAAPKTDAQVWQDLREGMAAALKADRKIAEAGSDAAADEACAAFEAAMDRALAAYSELVTRGVTGLFEDVLLERGLTADRPDGEGMS